MQAIQEGFEADPNATVAGRILVVEDDELIQSALRKLLETEGFEVEVAGDGKEGVQLARTMRPDAIVMDLVLPRMNGFDAAVVLRRDEETAEIPLIAVTASWLGSEFDRLREIGFSGALRKPFSGRELIEELEKHLVA